MGVRGQTLDGDKINVQFACLLAGVIGTAVMAVVVEMVMVVEVVVVLVVRHIDPGEF